MKTKVVSYISTFFVITTFMNCSKDQAEPVKDDPQDKTSITYENFAKALFQNNCSRCHGSTGSAASVWAFSDYNSVKNNESRINNAVLVNKTMPIGGALSAEELRKLKTWFENKMPEK